MIKRENVNKRHSAPAFIHIRRGVSISVVYMSFVGHKPWFRHIFILRTYGYVVFTHLQLDNSVEIVVRCRPQLNRFGKQQQQQQAQLDLARFNSVRKFSSTNIMPMTPVMMTILDLYGWI